MTIVDRVLFRMPKDAELQFPAMAVLQAYVAGFQDKMIKNMPGAQDNTYILEYEVDMPKWDWDFFQRAGFILTQQPQQLPWDDSNEDMLVDLSDERILSFRPYGKHAMQACSVLAGIGDISAPLPQLRKVKAKPEKHVWIKSTDIDCLEVLLNANDYELTGVCGLAGRETYLAASKGLAVVEIIQSSRSVMWLSKFANPLYRVSVDGTGTADIDNAKRNLEAVVDYLYKKEQLW